MTPRRPPPPQRFYLTFGQRYRREAHPVLPRCHANPEGFGVIVADDQAAARLLAVRATADDQAAARLLAIRETGGHFSQLCTEEYFDASCYPAGETFRIGGSE